MVKVACNCLVIVLFLCVSIDLNAQGLLLEKKISVKATGQKLSVILDGISTQNNIPFSYNSELIPGNVIRSIHVRDKTVADVLNFLLSKTLLSNKEEKGTIIIYKPAEGRQRSVTINKESQIYGYVKDCDTNTPIANVNVFVANSTIGTYTDANGYYKLSAYLTGQHELVFSHVSHFPLIQNVQMAASTKVEQNVCLKQTVKELNEVVIEDSRKEWKKNLAIFEKEFIGSTPNASRCKLVNPWVLDFEYDKETDLLTATAQDLLVLENHALGYTEKHLLVVFRYHKGTAVYLSKVKFEEMNSKNRIKSRRWHANREDAYRGSFEHFINALKDGTSRAEGFEISSIETLSAAGLEQPVKGKHILYPLDSSGTKAIRFSGLLKVVYQKDYQERRYYDYLAKEKSIASKSSYEMELRPLTPQISALELTDGTCIFLNENGVKNPLSFKQHGYWAWKRAADALPVNYKITTE